MNLPSVDSLDLKSKKVIVRGDLDCDVADKELIKESLFRLEATEPTLRYLFENDCDITLIGHRGRPDGKTDDKLSLKPVGEELEKLLIQKWGGDDVKKLKMHVMENLRFDKKEEEADDEYAKHLSEFGEFYINEAFSASHRNHTSIVNLAKLYNNQGKMAYGFRFIKEIENLTSLKKDAQKPVVVVLGGVKDDKLGHVWKLAEFADKLLIGGRLPDSIPDYSEMRVDVRFEVARLLPDKEDLTIHSIEAFEREVKYAKTLFLAGPLGKYEEEGHRTGTKRVFDAIVSSGAKKVAAGGDTIRALNFFGITDKFDWVSVGGGASLEFLSEGTLPGIITN